MLGKITRASVEEYAKDKGLEPIQIDGIPEGFSFIEPDIKIGDITHNGNLVVFIPNYPWEREGAIIKSRDYFELIEKYSNTIKIR